ncbi:hypothetical protein [Streptomyces phaeochromogenes]|uniref:hypothetical protein n=1 Tax=Streptomyces phaeochromogenes TaxID=1923 RepID=UPI0038641317|nr:hypothetical protein OHB08_01900 [Streptomyces phaeochromogenes]
MAELGGRRRRRNWQLIGAMCALLIIASAVYALRHILHGGLEPSDTAGVLGLPLGATGLAAAVTALRKPMEGNDSDLARARAATPAKQVEAGEGAVWRQLLGDDVRRINLTYALQPAAARPAVALPAGRLTADAAGPVSVPDIVTYYRATRPLRLVVTGAPGAGKTSWPWSSCWP